MTKHHVRGPGPSPPLLRCRHHARLSTPKVQRRASTAPAVCSPSVQVLRPDQTIIPGRLHDHGIRQSQAPVRSAVGTHAELGQQPCCVVRSLEPHRPASRTWFIKRPHSAQSGSIRFDQSPPNIARASQIATVKKAVNFLKAEPLPVKRLWGQDCFMERWLRIGTTLHSLHFACP